MRTRKCCIKTLVPVRPPTLAHVKVRAHTHAGQAHAHRRSWALARRCLLALRLDVDARAAQKCLRTGAVASHAVAQRSAGNLAAEGQFGRPSPSSMHTPSPARVRTHRRACTRACLPVMTGAGAACSRHFAEINPTSSGCSLRAKVRGRLPRRLPCGAAPGTLTGGVRAGGRDSGRGDAHMRADGPPATGRRRSCWRRASGVLCVPVCAGGAAAPQSACCTPPLPRS